MAQEPDTLNDTREGDGESTVDRERLGDIVRDLEAALLGAEEKLDTANARVEELQKSVDEASGAREAAGRSGRR